MYLLLYNHASLRLTAYKVTLISSQLQWQSLLPDQRLIEAALSQPIDNHPAIVQQIQPRLNDALLQFMAQPNRQWFLLRSKEQPAYYQLVEQLANQSLSLSASSAKGWSYQATSSGNYKLIEIDSQFADFCRRAAIHSVDWIESDQLFGHLSYIDGNWIPKPGLLHQANGGMLILSLRTLLTQPLLWLRLKQAVQQKAITWIAPDERRPYLVNFEPIPLQIKLILCGDRDSQAEFQMLEPDLAEQALYTEIEEQWHFDSAEQLTLWAQWLVYVADQHQLLKPDKDCWSRLIREGWRYTGDQQRLPLCPVWLSNKLADAAYFGTQLDEQTLRQALEMRDWQTGYLPTRMVEEISHQQKLLRTQGEIVGQINGLGVLDLPGHPRPWGEPSRISCVVHFGDGEVQDIERKVELGGNLHAKGMMIIQAWLISELELDQQLPFSASMVFEQSYGEVDGDSASLAELCVLVSALAEVPINQALAITGSVDQFGNVQAVGGLNEKIEGFFDVCSQRGFSPKQGVIIPQSNIQHLSLSDRVIEALKAGTFQLYPISRVETALNLLMQYPWIAEEPSVSLLSSIQERIRRAINPEETENRRPWPLRWLNWFNRC